ncbi:hypothetical protein HFP72_31050 [Nocardiopsis sp. ARC36]
MSQLISEDLFACAVDLSDEGAHEFAFPSIVACGVFSALEFGGSSILGGDLWKKVDGVLLLGRKVGILGAMGAPRSGGKYFLICSRGG